MSTAITRDQFIRGFRAIQTHYAGRTLIEQAMFDAGWEDSRIGYDPIVIELRHQLEERCGDTANDPYTGTLIDYALNEGGECSDPSIGLALKIDSAEAVWTWWEATKTGPFAPLSLTRYDFLGDIWGGPGREACADGDWVAYAEVMSKLVRGEG